MKSLKTYAVQMMNRTKQTRWRTITKCVSPGAACNVADIKEKMQKTSQWNPFYAINAYEKTDNNETICYDE